jgi:hypothetical protein
MNNSSSPKSKKTERDDDICAPSPTILFGGLDVNAIGKFT